jgi:hypothetical protein
VILSGNGAGGFSINQPPLTYLSNLASADIIALPASLLGTGSAAVSVTVAGVISNILYMTIQ